MLIIWSWISGNTATVICPCDILDHTAGGRRYAPVDFAIVKHNKVLILLIRIQCYKLFLHVQSIVSFFEFYIGRKLAYVPLMDQLRRRWFSLRQGNWLRGYKYSSLSANVRNKRLLFPKQPVLVYRRWPFPQLFSQALMVCCSTWRPPRAVYAIYLSSLDPKTTRGSEPSSSFWRSQVCRNGRLYPRSPTTNSLSITVVRI